MERGKRRGLEKNEDEEKNKRKGWRNEYGERKVHIVMSTLKWQQRIVYRSRSASPPLSIPVKSDIPVGQLL